MPTNLLGILEIVMTLAKYVPQAIGIEQDIERLIDAVSSGREITDDELKALQAKRKAAVAAWKTGS